MALFIVLSTEVATLIAICFLRVIKYDLQDHNRGKPLIQLQHFSTE